ncbi:hypothetical protein BD289DRAFT_478703 [Coniella lustricola]|uniref:Rho GTPase activator n=1 Tax=Coniella lustricola TaxID=2025994 RepID=A0A2T3ALI8_9PEZI|nr:hypothetical protein BD289DRAFT_478703 [Coniella lustricola]
MADANASSDYLPQIPRDRSDSIMSLGAGINLSEDGAAPLNNGSSSGPPDPTPPATATAKAPPRPDSAGEKMVQEVLTSEIGVATMLNRLKQSIASAKEFANFLKKRASIEENNSSMLKRLSQSTSDNMRRADHLGGTFNKAFDGMMVIHERIAENGLQYAMSLYQMTEDLLELAAIAEKQRKGWKQSGLAAEQRVVDVEAQMRKSQAKYYSLAEEYDRARTGDSSKSRVFGIKGPKSAAQHEEELLRKVQAADQDYQNKVQVLLQERGQLISATRPEAIRALQDIVRECDSGLLLQMQKFASFNEKLLLSNGLSISPLKNSNGARTESMSLREIVNNVDGQKDLSDFLCQNRNKVPPRTGEPKYERHPVLGGGPAAGGPSHPPQHQATKSQPAPTLSQPPAHARQDSFQGPSLTIPVGQSQPASNQESEWPRTSFTPVSAGQRPPSNQHERSFSSASLLTSSGPTASQPPYSNRNSMGPGGLLGMQQGNNNTRFNGNVGGPSLSAQGPPQLGALAFQEPPPPSTQPSQFSLENSSREHHAPHYPSQGSTAPVQESSRPVFGVSLSRLYDRDQLAVPMVVYQCIQAVDLFGLNLEGIYRLSGSLPHVNKLKSMFDTDATSPELDFRNPENFFHDVNSVAGLLKQFFRDLPDPLLTREYYDQFIAAARHDDEIVRRDSLHATINNLPDPNYATLRALMLHLNRVVENSSSNRMTTQNLAIVFGPTLMGGAQNRNIADSGFQCKVVDTILQNTLQIFDDD